jgi:hypothetical protein
MIVRMSVYAALPTEDDRFRELEWFERVSLSR